MKNTKMYILAYDGGFKVSSSLTVQPKFKSY